MVGRFAGALHHAAHPRRDTCWPAFAVGAFVVMLIAVVATGPLAMWALILVGLFHSIMFPTIFTLGIKGLGPLTEEGSGLLIMAIAGGALVVVQGWLADRYGLQTVVPPDRRLRALRPVLRALGRASRPAPCPTASSTETASVVSLEQLARVGQGQVDQDAHRLRGGRGIAGGNRLEDADVVRHRVAGQCPRPAA